MVKGVIFDMDGLMFDTERLWDTLWEPACAALGLPLPADMEKFKAGGRGLAGDNLRRHVAEYIPGDPQKVLDKIWQLGDEVTGPLPKQLVGGNYFAEQRQFNLSLQANGINFDQFLKVRGQTVEEFRTWLHTQAERKLRSWLGLLLVAEAEGLQPTETEVTAALTDWNEKLDGERTFPANDARKVRQRLARAKAAAFVVAHSTLTPPPSEPLVQEPEAK